MKRRALIVWDGKAYHVRAVRTITHDLIHDHMLYRCDKPVANDLPKLGLALRAFDDYLRRGKVRVSR